MSRLPICAFGALAAIALAAETATFSKSVYPIFEEAGCRGCHNSDGVASATRLQFPEQSVPAEIEQDARMAPETGFRNPASRGARWTGPSTRFLVGVNQ